MTEQNYKALLDEHGAEQLAENFIFPVRLSKKQKKESDKTLNEAINQRRAQMSSDEAMQATLMQLRFQIEDYLAEAKFDKDKTFGFFLKTYITELRKKRNEFADEINIKPTELSQYINNHRTPPTSVIIRLELHSHKIIPATDWYKLLEKENLHLLSTNKALRIEQQQFVKKTAHINMTA